MHGHFLRTGGEAGRAPYGEGTISRQPQRNRRCDQEHRTHPKSQNGRSSFPFAQSGAGDVFCLTALEDEHEGECVVVYIWHDSDAHTIEAFSFADFIYSRLVTVMTGMSHLLDDLSSTANARLCLLADIRRLAAYLPADEATRFQAYLEHPAIEVEVSYGRTERVPCLITDEDYKLLMQGKRTNERWPVNIVARWDVRPA